MHRHPARQQPACNDLYDWCRQPQKVLQTWGVNGTRGFK